MPSDLLEDSAIQRLRDEGIRALTDIFASERARLRRMIARRLDKRVLARLDASGVVQDAFLRASRELDDYLTAPQVNPLVWLRILARRTVYDLHERHLQSQKRDPDREDSPALIRELSASMPAPDSDAARAEVHRRVNEFVAGMNEKDRIVLTLRHVDELTIREIAEEVDITVEAAKKRYIRALRRLREACGHLNPFENND